MPGLDFTLVQNTLAQWARTASGLPVGKVFWSAGRPLPEPPYITLDMPSILTVGNDWTEDKRKRLVLADDVVESVAASQLTLTAHAYLTGDGPIRFETTGTLPAPLQSGVDYWAVKTGANTIKIADTFKRAIAAVPVTLTLSGGTGVHTIVDTAKTVRAGQELTATAKGIRKFTLALQCFAVDATGLGHARAILHELVARAGLPSLGDILDQANLALLGFDTISTLNLIEQTTVFRPRAVVNAEFHTASEVSEDGTIIESVAVQSALTGDTRVYGNIN